MLRRKPVFLFTHACKVEFKNLKSRLGSHRRFAEKKKKHLDCNTPPLSAKELCTEETPLLKGDNKIILSGNISSGNML